MLARLPAGEPLTIYTAKRGLRVALMEREAAGIADSEDKVCVCGWVKSK